MPTVKLNATQKVAALLISLGPERAAKVFRHLSEQEVEKITIEITKLQRVDNEDMNEIVKDFYGMCVTRKVVTEGGLAQAKEILDHAFGPQLASSYIDRASRSLRVKVFDYLRNVDYKNLVAVLQNEHPQTIAVVLSYTNPNQSPQIVSELPQNIQADVIRRVAQLDRPHPDYLKIVERTLENKLSLMVTVDSQEIGGINYVANIMNRVERTIEKHVFDELKDANPDLVQEIRKQMFVFEDIVILDDVSVQLFIREVDTKDLAIALKVANREVSDTIFRNMSTRMQETIQSDMEYLKNIRMSDVNKAQQRIVSVIRKLEEEGQIVISKGGKDDVII
ncbi:MAG: flagellar motor switch protein FliG [Erysipelothrix sp.]|nr:flagellar motor switch protein FliG [Erysipelothrix sp.]